MAQRRGRQPSSQLPPNDGAATDETAARSKDGAKESREPKSLAALQFDDFRRRHVKQNKDIIKQHVAIKMAMATLQNEANVLRAEILAVRAKNTALVRELREWEMGRTRCKLPGQGGLQGQTLVHRQAIEAVLTAVPALQQLLASMSSLPVQPYPTPTSGGATAPALAPSHLTQYLPPSGTSLSAMPAVETVRLAATAASAVVLGPLAEGSECGSEVDPVDLDERRERTRRRARTSQLASRATRNTSPPPQTGLHDPVLSPMGGVDIASPGLSPNGQQSPRPRARNDKAKKRRQSGLISPFLGDTDASVRPSSELAVGALTRVPMEHTPEERWETDVDRREIPSSAPKHIRDQNEDEQEDEEAVLDLVLVEMARTGSAAPQAAIVATTESNLAPPRQAIQEDSNGISAATTNETEGDTAGGIRGRRSRNSVMSYKEPSLNKKMRKPDGTTVEDALRGSRASLALSTASAAPADIAIPDSAVTTSSSAGSSQKSRSTRTETVSAALRRKSTLPRAGRKTVKGKNHRPIEIDSGSEDDDNDDDELSSLHSDPASEGEDDDAYIQRRQGSSRPTATTVSHAAQRAPESSPTVDNGGWTVHGPISVSSRSASTSVSTLSASAPASYRTSGNSSRSSPRKSPSKKPPNYARPSSSSLAKKSPGDGSLSASQSASFMTTLRIRDPLIDRADNAQAQPGRKAGMLSSNAGKVGVSLSGKARAAGNWVDAPVEVKRPGLHSGRLSAI